MKVFFLLLFFLKLKQCVVFVSGLNSPDSALYEGLKLLCSLLVTFVGKGLYGNTSTNEEVHFVHQGIIYMHFPMIQTLPPVLFVKNSQPSWLSLVFN